MAEIIWDSELGPSWPDDWEHTTVHAQFVAVTGDGADTDRLPDIAPSGNGEVIFTPSLRTVRYVGADGPYVVSLKQYRAVVDSEGYLCTPDTFGQPGERGIVLPSTDSPVIEPRGEDDNAFTWRVDFDIPAVTIRSDHIAVPVDGPYNLVDLLSPERAAGVVHIIDRVSAREAIEAASDAEAARDLVLPARDETLAARDETLQLGITVDTSVGKRIFIGDTMIHGDTGVRSATERITPDPTSGWLRIRRVGNLVEVRSNALSVPASGTTLIGNIPSGYRPIGIAYFKAVPYWGSETSETARIMANGDFTVLSMSPENAMNFHILYYTSNPWPTSLPGTPA